MPAKILETIENFKLPILLSLVGIVLIIGGIFASGLNQQSASRRTTAFPKESMVEASRLISVDVSGAVNKPGVYKLNEGSRIEEAVKEAGGFSDSANKEYISKYLNMAQKLIDGSKVYVPIEGDSSSSGNSQSQIQTQGAESGAKVNINSSTQSELEALPGIGTVTASRIISDRPYQTIEDLLNKKIVKKSTFEKIKDQLVIY